jgi:hypothetical protein
MRIQFKNLAEFNRKLAEFSDKVPELHLALQKKIALELFTRIVLKTPVGNPDLWQTPIAPPGYVGGRARANWQIGLNATNDSEIPGEDQSGTGTIAAGLSGLSGARPYGTIWIFNNVPYIIRLEEGWSYHQAPAGMVGVALAEVAAGLI